MDYDELSKKFDVPVAWLNEVIPYLNPCNDETIYKDIKFKSRGEARWAIFFDELSKEWKYTDGVFHLLNMHLIINGKRKGCTSLYGTPDKSEYFDALFYTKAAKSRSKYYKF
ncbi:MAG TPA: hypothetical protein VGK06_15490 [Methanosarcina sp.]|jgi:hypothetical protein